jgi:ribosomal protein S1
MFGYSDKSLFPQDVASVRLEMFDNRTFRRGVEYELTDALAKRIEADTPYKIITSKNRADTVMTGQITNISEGGLSIEYELGGVLEREVLIRAVVNWKNLKTGELLINNQPVAATASYTSRQNQDFKYASTLAANKLAQKIVELMETKW